MKEFKIVVTGYYDSEQKVKDAIEIIEKTLELADCGGVRVEAKKVVDV